MRDETKRKVRSFTLLVGFFCLIMSYGVLPAVSDCSSVEDAFSLHGLCSSLDLRFLHPPAIIKPCLSPYTTTPTPTPPHPSAAHLSPGHSLLPFCSSVCLHLTRTLGGHSQQSYPSVTPSAPASMYRQLVCEWLLCSWTCTRLCRCLEESLGGIQAQVWLWQVRPDCREVLWRCRERQRWVECFNCFHPTEVNFLLAPSSGC